MASSSNRKSNSSVSKASKPTFRRAGSKAAAPRPKAVPAPAPRPAAKKPIASYTARTRVGAPSKARQRPAALPQAAAPSRKKATVSRPRGSAPGRALTAPSAKGTLAAPAPQKPVKQKPVKQKPAKQKPAKQKAPAASGTSPRAAVLKKTARRAAPGLTTVAAAPRAPREKGKGGPLALVGGVLATLGRLLVRLLSVKVAAVALAAALVLGIGGVVVANSPIFAATDIQIEGSEHVSAETAERLVSIPEGTTLFNVDASAITAALSENPWVSGVTIERQFPHTLRITPQERSVAAIVYIPADDIAWAIGSDGCWIAPVSLSVTVDAEGNLVDAASGETQGDAAEGGDQAVATQTITGVDAARAIAHSDGAILFTDVPADVKPSTGREVTSDVVLAGLSYANGFSPEFIAQIQSLSLPSVDAITAYLNSGIEVSLGAPDDIETKERVVTRLLEQQEGVTYINVRVPDSYTYRSAPSV